MLKELLGKELQKSKSFTMNSWEPLATGGENRNVSQLDEDTVEGWPWLALRHWLGHSTVIPWCLQYRGSRFPKQKVFLLLRNLQSSLASTLNLELPFFREASSANKRSMLERKREGFCSQISLGKRCRLLSFSWRLTMTMSISRALGALQSGNLFTST